MRKWLLPEAIEDVLPAEAARLEALRRVLAQPGRARGHRPGQPPPRDTDPGSGGDTAARVLAADAGKRSWWNPHDREAALAALPA